MRTLLTYVGCAAASMLLLISMAWMPAGPAQFAPQRPLALTQTAEPPTPTLDASTATPGATATLIASTPLPERPTLPPTETPTPLPPTATPDTTRPTLTPTRLPTATAVPDDGGGEPGIADPYITKRGSLDRAQVGDFVEFTLTVGNTGSAAAIDVVVTDALPGFLTLYNATTTRGLISVAGNTVTIQIGTVEPGELITITVLTRVNRQVAPPDNLNTATLSTSSAGDDPANNASSAALITTLAPTATPSAAPTAAMPTSAPTAVAQPTSTSPAARPTSAPPASQPTSAPPAVHPTATASAAVVLPPTGADASGWGMVILPLLLLALGTAVVSAVMRRRSLR